MKNLIKVISTVFGAGIVLLLLIQLIPYGKDHTNPRVVSEPKWDSQQTRVLVERVCFDCHSNQTIWPWYSQIAPASWLIYRDVVEGRHRLNFSDWHISRKEEPGEISSAIAEGEMPPLQYLLMHASARLTSAEKAQLIKGINITTNQ